MLLIRTHGKSLFAVCVLTPAFLVLAGWLAGCTAGASADRTSAPAAKIDTAKSGVEESGLWRYEHTVSSPGSKSEGYHGKLLYNGVVLPEPAGASDYYQTPWGPMYWVGDATVLWGTHGWMPSVGRQPTGQALPVPSEAGPGAAGTPATRIDLSKEGVYSSGLWRYESSVSGRGMKSEGYHGKLLYNGAVVPEPASINDYYQTPWGPMYWVGEPPIPWGDHGWMPHTRLCEPAGQVLTVPATEGGLIVCAEILAAGALATPDRLEGRDWVLADLKKFGVPKGHVQQGWLRLDKEPVTIHDTKRWGTAQMRLADTGPDKPLAVEIVGRGTLSLTPPPEGAATEATSPGIRPQATPTVELPREVGATRLVKYTMQGLPFDEVLDLYLAFRVESLGRILVVGPEADGKTVTVKDVDTVMIRLTGDDPNQAAWCVTSVKGQAVEPLGRVEYEGDTANVFKIALNGTFKTLFRVQQKGRATVALEYRSVTGENKPATKSFKVTLNVQATAAKPSRSQAGSSKP